MSLSLVSVLVSQPVLVCVVVLRYVAVFVSGGFWVQFWRGWQVVASVDWTSPILNDLYCLPFRQWSTLSKIIIITITIIIFIIIIITKKDSMRYTNYKKMFATTCGVHKPP